MMLVGLPSMANVGNVASGLSDGDPVTTWVDSSGNGYDATQSGSSRPTFKTSIVNGMPVVRFTSAGTSGLNLSSSISGTTAFTCFAVLKANSSSETQFSIAGTAAGPFGPVENSDAATYVADRVSILIYSTATLSGAWHVLTGTIDGSGGGGAIYSDGTSVGAVTAGFSNSGNFSALGYRPSDSTYSNGDIAEIVFYNVVVGSTDRANVEKYLGTKYAITVAGGSAVQPDTVTGLLGWWKADSLG